MIDINASLRDILNRSGQGFDQMLAGVQGGIGKLDASLQYARQRRSQYDLIDYQANKQIEKYKETVALQKEADREQREELRNLTLQQKAIEVAGKVKEEQIKAEAKGYEELFKQIEQENEDIVNITKPLVEFGFNPAYIPRATPTKSGDIVYRATINEKEGGTTVPVESVYQSIPEFTAKFAPFIAIANKFKETKEETIDNLIKETKVGDVTFVGRGQFNVDMGEVRSGSDRGKKIAEEYLSGKRQPKVKQDVYQQVNERELETNLNIGYHTFNALATKYEMPGTNYNVNSIGQLRTIIEKAISESTDELELKKLNADLDSISKAQQVIIMGSTFNKQLDNNFDMQASYTPGVGFKGKQRTSSNLD